MSIPWVTEVAEHYPMRVNTATPLEPPTHVIQFLELLVD